MPLRLTIAAKPGSRKPGLSVRGEMLVVAVREPALDGRANEAIESAVAAWLGLPRRSVRIVRGGASRVKVVEISGADDAVVAEALTELGATVRTG